jgi:preprotein translocase subunit SecE
LFYYLLFCHSLLLVLVLVLFLCILLSFIDCLICNHSIP